jgi:hypothetical protein
MSSTAASLAKPSSKPSRPVSGAWNIGYMDLLQIYRFGKEILIEDTMEALHDLVRMGKVRRKLDMDVPICKDAVLRRGTQLD